MLSSLSKVFIMFSVVTREAIDALSGLIKKPRKRRLSTLSE